MKFQGARRGNEWSFAKNNSLEFGKSCEALSWNHCTSSPHHRSETNGDCRKSSAQSERRNICGIVAVRSVQRMVGGTAICEIFKICSQTLKNWRRWTHLNSARRLNAKGLLTPMKCEHCHIPSRPMEQSKSLGKNSVLRTSSLNLGASGTRRRT